MSDPRDWKKSWKEQSAHFLTVLPILLVHAIPCVIFVGLMKILELWIAYDPSGKTDNLLFGKIPWRYVFDAGDLELLLS